MAPHEGLGAVIGNGGELKYGFDEFEVPRPSSDVISSRDIENRFNIFLPGKGKSSYHMQSLFCDYLITRKV